MQVHCATLITLVFGTYLLTVFENIYSKASKLPKSYSFSYTINYGDVVSQHTEEKQMGKVYGSYSFLQPDGLTRFVHYQVLGDMGFQAVVQYTNPSKKLTGHLRFPKDFNKPVRLLEPVAIITDKILRSLPPK